MPDNQSLDERFLPVYGTFQVYPNGSRNEADEKLYETPCLVTIGADDWFSFSFGAVRDVTDDDVRQFADAVRDRTHLRKLDLGGCSQVTDRGLACLAPFDQIEAMTLMSLSKVTARGLAKLGRFKRLRRLSLSNIEAVDDSTAEALSDLNELIELDMGMCPRLTDAGAVHLSRLKRVESIDITSAQISDRGVAALASLPYLRALSLTDGRFTDRSLEHLARSPTVDDLLLPNCRSFLRRLLTGYGLSRAGLKRFREAKPDCRIWSQEINEEYNRMMS